MLTANSQITHSGVFLQITHQSTGCVSRLPPVSFYRLSRLSS